MNKKIVKIYSTNGLATKKDLNGVEIRLNNKIKTTEVRMNTDLKAIEERLNNRIDRIQQYIDFKLKPVEEMSQDYKEFKNKVFDRFDWIISKLQKFEQEFIIQNEHAGRMLDRIENHEKRVTCLEKTYHDN